MARGVASSSIDGVLPADGVEWNQFRYRN
ncbi:hypothetical protein PSHT_09773 [Puccinia striiformis]|uniref:Uncharacterized protein n=2 Tax=Puccinia striiformis TaxID=27350 RepID=A0A2S4VEH9_9BASI|nr:hypothetical protein PSHT_15659 [Puccinia striiformis]POV95459.1 hypothetical protein PSHT_15660 [Puccinia striiformis]POW05381.1 hypothetical protein PSTT_09735 [Puccinia striiformis]POW07919.1 hypothetical protein PSHT_09773 [Puccinia striiformis]